MLYKVIVADSYVKYEYFCRENRMDRSRHIFVSSTDKNSLHRIAGLRMCREDVIFLDTPYSDLREHIEFMIGLEVARTEQTSSIRRSEMIEERKPLCEEIVRTYDDTHDSGLTTKIVTVWYDGQFGEHLSFESITFVVEKTKIHEGGELTIDRELACKLVELFGSSKE